MFSHPVLSRVFEGLNDLRSHFKFLLDNDEASVIAKGVAVIREGVYGDQLVISKFLKSGFSDSMRSKNERVEVGFKELFNSIWSKLDNVEGTCWVSFCVLNNSIFVLMVCGVGPEEVHDDLMFKSCDLGWDDDWSFQVLNVAKFVDSGPNTSVASEDLAADGASERHVLKEIIHLLENRVWLVEIFFKSDSAFFSKACFQIDSSVFVTSSQKMDLLWEFDL